MRLLSRPAQSRLRSLHFSSQHLKTLQTYKLSRSSTLYTRRVTGALFWRRRRRLRLRRLERGYAENALPGHEPGLRWFRVPFLERQQCVNNAI
jgi:hypothetical protein